MNPQLGRQAAYQRSRLSDFRGALGMGLPPIELWGVATKDPTHVWNERTRRIEPRRRTREEMATVKHRSPGAIARRRAKRAAKMAGVTLKSYLRRSARAEAA